METTKVTMCGRCQIIQADEGQDRCAFCIAILDTAMDTSLTGEETYRRIKEFNRKRLLYFKMCRVILWMHGIRRKQFLSFQDMLQPINFN